MNRFPSPLRIALTLLPELEQRVKQEQVTKLMIEHGFPIRRGKEVLQTLAKAGILTIHYGAGGGFSLTKNPQDVTLAQIMGALEEAAPFEFQDVSMSLRRAFQCVLDGKTDQFTLADLK